MTDTSLEVRVRRLEPRDDRSGFRSGNIDLDRFFQRYAGQNQFRHHIGSTYVAVQTDQILGFVTVSSGEMVAEKLTKSLRRRLPAYPLPVLRLASLRERVGGIGVAVDAKPDAVASYSSMGFQPVGLVSGALGDRPEPMAMFLPIGPIAAAAGVTAPDGAR